MKKINCMTTGTEEMMYENCDNGANKVYGELLNEEFQDFKTRFDTNETETPVEEKAKKRAKAKKNADADSMTTGYTTLQNGKKAYTNIYHSTNNQHINVELAHNDFVQVVTRIREEGVSSIEELKAYEVYGSTKDLYNDYGRAIHNGFEVMVSSKRLSGLISVQKAKSNGYADANGAVSYMTEMALFRPSVFAIVINPNFSPEEVPALVLSNAKNYLIDYCKLHKLTKKDISEREKDLAQGIVLPEEEYMAYPVSLDEYLSNDDNRDRISTLPYIEDGYKRIEFTAAVEEFGKIMKENGFPESHILVFCTKANRFITEGIVLDAAELSTVCGVSLQTVYNALNKTFPKIKSDFANLLVS